MNQWEFVEKLTLIHSNYLRFFYTEKMNWKKKNCFYYAAETLCWNTFCDCMNLFRYVVVFSSEKIESLKSICIKLVECISMAKSLLKMVTQNICALNFMTDSSSWTYNKRPLVRCACHCVVVELLYKWQEFQHKWQSMRSSAPWNSNWDNRPSMVANKSDDHCCQNDECYWMVVPVYLNIYPFCFVFVFVYCDVYMFK